MNHPLEPGRQFAQGRRGADRKRLKKLRGSFIAESV